MFQLRPLRRLERTTARLQFWITRRPFAAGTVAVALTGSFGALSTFSLGFRPVGVKSGSPAAFRQSRMGDVGRGSVFSTLQSAGAGGSGALILYGIPAGGAALLTVVLGYRMRNRATIRHLRLKRRG